MSLTPADRVRRGRVRGVVAILSLLAWGAALSGLVQRDVQRSVGERLAELALRVNPGNVFYRVTQNGRHIGWASSTIDTLPVDSASFLVLRDEIVADLDVGGRPQRISALTEIRMTRRFGLQTFDVDVGTAGMQMRVAGRAEGDTAVSYVTGPLDRGAPAPAAADTQRVRVSGPILLPTLLPLATILGDDPRVGRQATFTAFDPATRAARPMTMEIVAESLFAVEDSARMDAASGRWVGALRDTVRAWRVAMNGDQSTGWIDAQGRVVEATNELGVTLRRVAFEMAFENWRLEAAALAAVRGAASGGIDERSVIAARIPIPRRELVSLRTRITAPALNRLQLDGGRQRLSGNEVTIQTEPAGRLQASYTMPVGPEHRTMYRVELSDELLLHLRSQSIVRLGALVSKTASGGAADSNAFETDPRIVVERLTRWVHDSLSKVASTSVPDALEVFTARRGDANEHTQLFTAVARSLGIPTRVAMGLVLVSGKFYYHAWPEVYLGDWVAADPTFGQFPVGATHLRLMTGSLGQQAELRRLLSSLSIEVLEAR